MQDTMTEHEKRIYTMGMIDGLKVASETVKACAESLNGLNGSEKTIAALSGIARAFDDKVDAETKKAGL